MWVGLGYVVLGGVHVAEAGISAEPSHLSRAHKSAFGLLSIFLLRVKEGAVQRQLGDDVID